MKFLSQTYERVLLLIKCSDITLYCFLFSKCDSTWFAWTKSTLTKTLYWYNGWVKNKIGETDYYKKKKRKRREERNLMKCEHFFWKREKNNWKRKGTRKWKFSFRTDVPFRSCIASHAQIFSQIFWWLHLPFIRITLTFFYKNIHNTTPFFNEHSDYLLWSNKNCILYSRPWPILDLYYFIYNLLNFWKRGDKNNSFEDPSRENFFGFNIF